MSLAMARLQDAGKQIILVSPVPTFETSIPLALIRSDRVGVNFVPTKTVTDHLTDPGIMVEAVSLVAKRHGVPVVSSEAVFGPDGICVARIGDLPLYQDDDHLSVLGARMLAIEIDPVIRGMLDLPSYPDHRVEMERDLMGGVPSQ